MSLPLISIVIPVYCVEEYLEKCVSSVVSQTFTNIEVILVDDGSPDNCGNICDELAKQDSRIRVVHKENGGISSARNAGIDIARGKYLGFVDSDDWVDPDMYQTLYENAEKHNVDIAICERRLIYPGKIEKSSKSKCTERILSQSDIFKILFSTNDTIYAFVWNKLFRKELFDNTRFPVGQTYEDVYIISELLLKCNKAWITDKEMYNYLQRAESITGKGYTKGDINCIIAAERNYKLINEQYPEYVDNVRAYVCKWYFLIVEGIALSGLKVNEEEVQIIRKLKREVPFIVGSNSFTVKKKLLAIILKINYRVYSLLIKVLK